MKVYVALNQDIEHTDVLGVYSTPDAARRVLGANDVEAFDLDDVDAGDPAFTAKGHEFVSGDFGKVSNEHLCCVCGDVESAHAPILVPASLQKAE